VINPPRTREEAKRRTYRRWINDRSPVPYDPSACAYHVWGSAYGYQCSRKPGHGPWEGYCKQHAKMLEKQGEPK
jgi:hypothetical protein